MVFDSSAIYMAIGQGKTKQLGGQYTSMLAMFELGNIIWKESVLANRYSQKEAVELFATCELVLEKMRILHPDPEDIYRLAARCRISFYDAAYASLAVKLKTPLATLDHKFADKIRSFIEIVPID